MTRATPALPSLSGARTLAWPAVLLGLLLLVLGVYRVALTSSGQLYWPDEYRYVHALHLLDSVRQGDLATGLSWIFTDPTLPPEAVNMGARPTYVVLAALPAVFQGVLNVATGLGPDDPGFYRIAALANVPVTLAIAVLFFLLARTFVADSRLALLGTAVFSLLVNTNLYVRHLFPYDLALCLLLWALYLIVSEQNDSEGLRRRAIVAGLLAGLAFTTYPGYDPFVVILVAAVLRNPAGSWRHVLWFGSSMVPIALLLELLAQFGGLSFVGLTIGLFGTLATEQGSFSEGLLFLPKYLWTVEKVTGMLLLLGLVAFAVSAVRGRQGRVETGLVGAAALAYVAYGILGVVFHLTVQYGRLVHMYLPFVVLAGTFALDRLTGGRRRFALAAVGLASLVSFVPAAGRALALEFPRDLEPEIVSITGGGGLCRVSVAATGSRLGAGPCEYLLENAGHVYPVPPSLTSVSPAGYALVREWEHPLQFRPFWFEGYSIREREALGREPLEIRLYRWDR